jgi:hypothetical protein
MDVEMTDSDCSEDYDNDPFFQQTGYAYFAQRQQLMKEAILADKQNNEADAGEADEERNQEDLKAAQDHELNPEINPDQAHTPLMSVSGIPGLKDDD